MQDFLATFLETSLGQLVVTNNKDTLCLLLHVERRDQVDLLCPGVERRDGELGDVGASPDPMQG